MANVSKQKITKILNEAYQKFGIDQDQQLTKSIAEYLAENYNKVTLTDKEQDDVQLFNNTLNQERLAKSVFTNVKDIRKGTSQYSSIIKLLPSVNRFTDLYTNGEKYIGYHEYIRIGLTLMGNKYSLNKFNYYDDKIFELRECQRQVQEDANPTQTEQFQRTWDALVQKEYGTVRAKAIEFTQFHQYVNFVWGRVQADKNKAKYQDWCMAQIDGLRFLGTEPFITSMHGDKANDRYDEYMKSKPKEKSSRKELLARLKGKV